MINHQDEVGENPETLQISGLPEMMFNLRKYK
jgi:hypothetical protein